MLAASILTPVDISIAVFDITSKHILQILSIV